MADFELPEILRLPLQELCLKIKICEIGNIEQVLGMALDAPSPKAINNAMTVLQEVFIKQMCFFYSKYIYSYIFFFNNLCFF